MALTAPNCVCVRVKTGHEDFKATDSRDADWLIVRCSEGFDGGLPLTNYELEVYSEENVYHVNTIYLNHTDRSGSSGPVFEVPGLEPGRNYRLHLYAVNAKGRSDPVVLEPVTLKGVAMYTTGESSEKRTSAFLLLLFQWNRQSRWGGCTLRNARLIKWISRVVCLADRSFAEQV